MNIASDKNSANKWNLTCENLDTAKKRKPKERKWISSNNSPKQRHNNYVKTKIDETQWNSRCKFSGDKTINHIISECSTLSPRESIRQDTIEWGRWSTGICARSLNLSIRTNLRIFPWKWHAENSLGFWDTNGSFNLGLKTRPSDHQQKRKEKRYKYLDLSRELENYETWKWRWYHL